jgi:hypothetical protein
MHLHQQNFHFQETALCCLSILITHCLVLKIGRLRFKCDGTCPETRFRLSAKRTTPFKSAGWGVSSVDYWQPRCAHQLLLLVVMFRGSEKGTGYPLHSPVSSYTSHPVCHRVPSYVNWNLLPMIDFYNIP